MEKRYYWMKLKEDFFSTTRIKKLRKVPGGDTFVLIYLKLALLSLNGHAVLEYEHLEESFEEELALKIDEDENSVFITVDFLKRTGLLVPIGDDTYKLIEIEHCIGSETAAAIRKRESRRQQILPQSDKPFVIEEGQSCDNVTQVSHTNYSGDVKTNHKKGNSDAMGESCDNVTQMSHKCHTVVPQVSQECHTDIDKDIDIEKKKETYVSKEKEFPEKRFEEKVIDEFIELLLRNEPLLRVPVIEEQKKKWYDPIEKLRERGYTEADILNTMRYALTNNFWKAHILTPEKFKIKFSQLLLKYRPEQTQQAKPSFNNFTGRQYDMEQLEMELLQTGTSTKV